MSELLRGIPILEYQFTISPVLKVSPSRRLSETYAQRAIERVMTLIEQMAKEHADSELKIRPLQPFEDYYKTTRAYEAGFRKAREMAAEIARDAVHYKLCDPEKCPEYICDIVHDINGLGDSDPDV